MRALLRLWRRWKTQYKLAKKRARKNGDPTPLVELYKCSNEFPQAVARQRAKMRRMLTELGSWWEDPRIFGLVNQSADSLAWCCCLREFVYILF